MDNQKAKQFVGQLIAKLSKEVYDDSAWDGSASRWETAEEYCADCLIDLNPAGQKKTKENCHLPYRHPGSNKINKNALRAMASGARGLPAVKGVPKEQIVKAANWIIRHWRGAFGKPAPASIYRLAGKQPPEQDKSLFLKSADGSFWFLGIYSNKFEDVEGDILSEQAHREFAKWANENDFHPQLTLLHLPRMPYRFWYEAYKQFGQQPTKMNELLREVYKGYAIGEVERIIPFDGFAAVVARVKPEAYPIAEKLSAMSNLGMSHGFVVLDFYFRDDADIVKSGIVVDRYRTYEVSILPRERAANKFTLPVFTRGKSMAISEQDKQWLNSVGMPQELIEAAEVSSDEARKLLERILDYKSIEEQEEEQDKPAEQADVEVEESASTQESEAIDSSYEQYRQRIIDDLKIADLHKSLDGLVKAVQELAELREQVTELSASLEQVRKQIASLERDEDEKIAAQFAPINWPAIGFSPALASETVVSKEVAQAVTKGMSGGDEEIDLFLTSLMGNAKGK